MAQMLNWHGHHDIHIHSVSGAGLLQAKGGASQQTSRIYVNVNVNANADVYLYVRVRVDVDVYVPL
jgi:hypothetical protein